MGKAHGSRSHTRHARAAAAALGESAPPGAVRALELPRVVVLAPPVEICRGEKVMEDEVVQDDDRGRQPPRVEERLDGRRVQRIVSDLEEEDVVVGAQRLGGRRGFVGGKRKRRDSLRREEKDFGVVVRDAGARRRAAGR